MFGIFAALVVIMGLIALPLLFFRPFRPFGGRRRMYYRPYLRPYWGPRWRRWW